MHLHERNHTQEFWRRIERAMPDCARRKTCSAERGGVLVAVAVAV
jgi:predicted metal-dependent hydrolase